MSSAPGEGILPTQLAPRRAERFGIPEVYAVLALLSFAAARFLPVLHVHYECPFRALAGIPCATCGMTHAFVYLAHGRVAEAFLWSPLGAILASAAWSFGVADLVRVAAGWPLPAVPARLARQLLLAGVLALLINWAYLVVHGLGR